MMNKRTLVIILAALTFSLLVLSVPANYFYGAQVSAILRWIGLGVGIVYLIVRNRFWKEQE